MKTETHLVDPKIAHPLGKLRGTIRRYVTIEGVLATLLFLVSWFWLAMLLDYGIFKLFAFDWALDAPKALRTIALVLAVAGLLAIVVTKIFLRLTREFSDESLALVLERRFPKILGDRLISAVQLADLDKAASYGFSVDMIKKTVDDVRARVDEIPVNQVFAWKRLYTHAILFVLLTVGLVGLTGGAYCAIAKQSPKQFWHEFTDVSSLLIERDALLKNTPWPRRAYLEVVNFPNEEIRVGRDVPNPRVRVAAYSFVWADSEKPMGWRPLTWADAAKVLPADAVPPLPLQQVRDARYAVDFGPFLYGSAHPFQAPTLPTDITHVPDEASQWPIDRVEQVFVQNEEVKAMLASKHGDTLAAIERAIAQLSEKATDPAMSRTMRKLKIPDEVELKYWGLKTSVEMKLRPEPNNEFSGVLSDLKESVRFFARGENFDTATKIITLVPPPTLTELKRDEEHPAYLYHKAPFVDAKDLPNDQKPYLADPQLLKGVKHILKDQAISLTGDKSRFDIPVGTEFTLKGTADKDLKEVRLIPKPGKFPGVDADNTDPTPINLPITDQRSFSVTFSAATKRQVLQQTEFDLFLKDTDEVTSKRLIQIVVEEDRPPEVDVVVDVIRKVGGTYICTPQALIPFTKDSKIRDDKGLNRAEFVYSYYMVEPQAITNKRGEYAAWLWNNIPLVPNIGNPIFRAAMVVGNYPLIQASQSVTESRVPIPGFADDYKKRAITLGEIKKLLDGARPSGSDVNVVKDVDFRSALDEVQLANDDVDAKACFDLKKVLAGLKRSSDTEIQNNYLLTVNVVAVDTNVEADRPGVAQNRETIVFRLVSDAELLTEIAREEATLADKLDDAIRRTAEVDNKFRSMAARFGGLNNPDAFIAEQTRATEIQELFGKARDILGELNADYARILLEYKANRLPQKLIDDTNNKIVKKLNEVVVTDIPQTEEAYGVVQGAVASSKVPLPENVLEVQKKLTALLFKLRDIRGGIGAGLDLKKLIESAEVLIKGVRQTQLTLTEWDRLLRGQVNELNVRVPVAPVSIVAGQKATVSVPVVVGALYEGNLTLKIEPAAGSGLMVVENVKLKDDDTEFKLEITAGFNKGLHTIRIIPDKGAARELKINVR